MADDTWITYFENKNVTGIKETMVTLDDIWMILTLSLLCIELNSILVKKKAI